MNITEHTKKNKMKLFTKEIDKKLFEQYPKGNDLENQIVVAKIFNPYGRGKWYLLNSDPQDPDYVWAIVDLFEVETGSVSRSELESIKVRPFNLGLERDLSWTPKPAIEVLKGLKQGKYFEQGGTFDSSNSGDGIGGTSDSSEIGETIGGTAASSIMARGGGIYKVGDTFIGTPNAKYDESWQLYKPSTSYVIDGTTKKVLSVHNTPIDAINARGTVNNKVDYKVYPKEHYENKMAKGGNIKQIKVGEEYRYKGDSSVENNIMDKIRPQLSNLKFAGNFYIKGMKNEGYLYFLDSYDKKFVENIIVNPSERIYRYYTRNTAIGGMIPLVKINLDNGLIYFNEANDFGDESIKFSTKGQKSEYINLVKATDEDYYETGGQIESSAKRKADNSNITNEELLNDLNKFKSDLEQFNLGNLKPSKIIGGGYKSSAIAKRLAKEWLENRISEYKMALEIRGVMAEGGSIYKHKYMDATAKILEKTNKGYKVEFTDNSARKPKSKIMYFNDIDFDKEKGYFEKMETGGGVDKFNNQEFIIETTMQIEHIFAKNEDEAINKWNKLHSRDTIKDSIVSIKNANSEGGGVENNRFFIKSNFGHFSVIDSTTNKMVVGYSKKQDAIDTSTALNEIKTDKELDKSIAELKTTEGYGKFIKKYANGGGITEKEFVQKKVGKVMKEFKAGELKSGSGKKVTNPKQAIAIGISEGKAGWKHKRKK